MKIILKIKILEFFGEGFRFIIKFLHTIHETLILNFKYCKTIELVILFVVTKFVGKREREEEEWNRNGIRKRKLICSSVESPLRSFIMKNRISCSIQCK